MPLTVLNVGYPLARVAEDTAGGAEQVLAMLDEGLVRAGHRSVVIAPAGSDCKGELFPSLPVPDILDDAAQQSARRELREIVQRVVNSLSPDIVHLHGIDFLDYLPHPGVQVLVTFHLPPSWYPSHAFSLQRPDTHLICVSQSQARACPPGNEITAVVENGVRLDRFRPGNHKQDYVLGLGRICPEKSFHLAMDAASACGIPFLLAGTVFEYPSHRAYFEESIRPRLKDGHEFLGPVGIEKRRELLASARCLLIPSLVPETSSLVAMEAMACGTPVVGFRTGALCEIIRQGETGFLVDSVEEMAQAIPATAKLDSEACRREAEARFSSDRMVEGYLELYEQVIAPGKQRAWSKGVGSGMQAFLIRDAAEIQRLKPEWEALWHACPGATSFQRPEWILAWIQSFQPAEPMLITVRRNGRLVGLAPLLIYSDRDERVLAFMGGGVSDYLDVLVEQEQEQERRYADQVVPLIWNQIMQESSRWDRVDFTDLPSNSLLLQNSPQVGNFEIEQHNACPVIKVCATPSDVRNLVPARQLRNLRNARARLERAGQARVELATAETLDRFLDALIRLHGHRWRQSGSPGVLADEVVQQFHRRVAVQFLEKGVVRLYGLVLDGRIIASLYSFFETDAVRFYLQAYDPEFAWLSPGTQIIGAMIEDAVRAGKTEIDLLRGREAYKYAWGARDVPTFRLQLRKRAEHTPAVDRRIAA